MTWLPSARDAVVNVACPEALSVPEPRVVVPSLNVTVPPAVTGVPLLVTVAVNVTLPAVSDGFGDDTSEVLVATAVSCVVIVRLHPPVIDPLSPWASSTTNKRHVPFGLIPLNAPAKVVVEPGAGAGDGHESALV